MKSPASLLLAWLLVFLAATATATTTPTTERTGGFVASFRSVPTGDGRLPLQGLAHTAAAPGDRRREIDPSRAWQVRWLDPDGRILREARIPDPGLALIGGGDRRQPLVVRFADVPAALLVEVRDAQGVLRGEVALDAASRRRADAQLAAATQRIAAAGRAVAKRAGDPPAVITEARRRLEFQVAVQQRLADRREVRCAAGMTGWRIPELVTARPCAVSDPWTPVASLPAVPLAPPRIAAKPAPEPMPVELRGKLVPAGAPKADQVTLTGHLRFAAGGPLPTVPITLYSWGAPGEGYGYVLQASPPDFAFSSPVNIGAVVNLQVVSPPPYLGVTEALGQIDVDTYREVTLELGATVSGRLQFPSGSTPPTQDIWLYYTDSRGQSAVSLAAPDHAYAFAVPDGSTVTLQATPPTPFLRGDLDLGVVNADIARNFLLQRGVLLRGRVVGPANYTVTIRDLASGDYPMQQSFAQPDFEIAVPPRDSTVEVSAGGWFPSAAWQPDHGADAEVEFVLQPRQGAENVVLTLRDGTGQPLPQTRVEAWQDEAFVRGGLSDAAGQATMELADGAYQLKVWPDTEQANQWSWESTRLFAEPALVAPLAVAGATQATLQPPAADWIDMRVVLPSEQAWPGCPGSPMGRLELLRDGEVVARGSFRQYYAFDSDGHRLVTGSGMHVVRYHLPGGITYASPIFRSRPGLRLVLERQGDAPQRLWTGTLRTHAGTPVANRRIGVSDELGITAWPGCGVQSDAGGRFQLPLCEGCLYSFEASASQGSQRRIVHVDEPVLASREEDLVLAPPLAFAPLAEGGATRVFGRGHNPFRLVFLAEGYAAERETYTDSNGNGLWDGVQYADVNGNGLWDSDEPYATYGNAAAPVAGSDPRATSEVFQDLNGDGVLSLDDRALFERNVRDYLRGLFSSHQFAAYQNAYQASALMAYSAQVGMDHGSVQRDTLFSAEFLPERGLLTIDYTAASQAAAGVDPDYTVVVVMINQPVPYGRVNSFVLASGGVLGGDVNDNVAGHEFGHNPGGLADEYSEFSGTYIGTDPGSANSTRFVERRLVPWGAWVPPSQDGRPAKPWLHRDGFFEGSSYQASGAFRPSQASMMRFMDSLLFNNASVDQLRRVHDRALRDWPQRLTITGAQRGCSEYEATWDVAALGATEVELRSDAHDGARVGGGAATGTAWVKRAGRQVYLVDAGNGEVLDIAAEPLVRCAGK